MDELTGIVEGKQEIKGTINYGNRGPRGPQGPQGEKGEKGDPASQHPYLSLERLGDYIYHITFDSLPEYNGELDTFTGGCSSYVANGKLYRNLDWNYAETAEFRLETKNFKGMSFVNGLNDSALDDELIKKLPYQVVDGVNNDGIMIATHVLTNDWQFTGCGDRSVNIQNIPFIILNNIKTLDNFSTQMTSYLNNINIPDNVLASGYLLQFIVTDGTDTYVILPPETSDGVYTVVDATENPKLSNFRWVNRATVNRTDSDMQDHPTGVERFNAMPCDLQDIKYTNIYTSPNYLSDFIGLRDTDKYSTDAELLEIYETAHQMFLERTRDGSLWQTMHSVVYSPYKMESLFVQEDYNRDYCLVGPEYQAGTGISIVNGIISCTFPNGDEVRY